MSLVEVLSERKHRVCSHCDILIKAGVCYHLKTYEHKICPGYKRVSQSNNYNKDE